MRARIGARRALGAAACVLFGVASAAAISAAAGEPATVRVISSGNHSERVKTIPITRRKGRAKRTVISIGPHRLRRLHRNDLLWLLAEQQFTTDCHHATPRCIGRPYDDYDPTLRIWLELATDNSPGGARISHVRKERCRQQPPYREHHCVIALAGKRRAVRSARNLPCPSGRCHLNLVADAFNRDARRREVLIVGGQLPSGKIKQDRGRVTVARHRGGLGRPAHHFRENGRSRSRLRLDYRARVLYSVRIGKVKRNTQLIGRARARISADHLPFNALVGSRLIVARSPRSAKPSRFVNGAATLHSEVSEHNGFNCTRRQRTCLIQKVGGLRFKRAVVNGTGERIPLHLNLVTRSKPMRSRNERSPRKLRIRPGPGVKATVYSAKAAG